jgi:hypothetical protein
MSATTLTARVRTVWESLAGVPVVFSSVVRVAVSPRSRLCPTGWAALVAIESAAIATAPDPSSAQIMQQFLSTVPAAPVTAADVHGSKLAAPELFNSKLRTYALRACSRALVWSSKPALASRL